MDFAANAANKAMSFLGMISFSFIDIEKFQDTV